MLKAYDRKQRIIQDFFEGKIGTVTFGDGSKSVIKGIGTVDIPGLLVFEDVRTYVFHMLRIYVIILCNWLIL